MPDPALLFSPNYQNRMMGLAGSLLESGGASQLPVNNAQAMARAIRGWQGGEEADRMNNMRQYLPEILREAPLSLVKSIMEQQFNPEMALKEAQFAQQQKERSEDVEYRQQTRTEDMDWRDKQGKLEMAKFEYMKAHNQAELAISQGRLGVDQAVLGLKQVEAKMQNQLREILFGDMAATPSAPDATGRPTLESMDK